MKFKNLDINSKLRMCLFAYLQLLFVTFNTIFMVKNEVVLVAITTVALNLVWTYNVSGVTFATFSGRLLYSLSTMLGALTGIFLLDFLNIR